MCVRHTATTVSLTERLLCTWHCILAVCVRGSGARWGPSLARARRAVPLLSLLSSAFRSPWRLDCHCPHLEMEAAGSAGFCSSAEVTLP